MNVFIKKTKLTCQDTDAEANAISQWPCLQRHAFTSILSIASEKAIGNAGVQNKLSDCQKVFYAYLRCFLTEAINNKCTKLGDGKAFAE